MPPESTDVILPWEWNLPVEAYMWLVIILLVGVIFYAARQGRDRKSLPDQLGRDVEDFAGVIQEANGPLTHFLVIFYLLVAMGIAGYIVVTVASGYRY